MNKYEITGGVQAAPIKTVLYGVEGIGKSTFAAQFPDPLFIDTEGSTRRMDVRRLPPPNSWAMLLDEVAEAKTLPCKTLVVDTADWAERLCASAVCARGKVRGIEDFGYGKGYTYLKEEFAKLLDALEEVIDSGRHVVVTAHAAIVHFDQPDEMGSYDRWAMKTTKQVAPLLREWPDMLLFANYKTWTEKNGNGANAKNKAQGGKRVMYTTHHPCWDAKNRFGLADELPFDYSQIAHLFQTEAPRKTAKPDPILTDADLAPAPAPVPKLAPIDRAAASAADAKTEAEYKARLDDALYQAGVPADLRQLMVANKVEEAAVRHAVAQKGYFPEDMPIRDYPADFVQGCLVAAWPAVYEMIQDYNDVPF